MSYLDDLYTRYMNGELINFEDPALYDNTNGDNPIYGTPVAPTGKSMYASKGVAGFDSANSSKPVDLNSLIASSGNGNGSVGGSEAESDYYAPSNSTPSSDGGGSTQSTANSITGTGDLGRSYLQQVLQAGDVTKNPWVTNQSLMDKIANFKPANTKEIAYKSLMDNLPSLVSGGSWIPAVNDKMIALSSLMQKAQSDSLIEDASIKDGVARNQLSNEVLGSLRSGQMSNPQEYASLMKMLGNIGAGKYDPKDVDTLFITPEKQASMKQSASATAISDDNTQRSLAQQMQIHQENMALQERLASAKQANAPDKIGKGLLEVGEYANRFGASLTDAKDIADMSEQLKKAYITATISHTPESATYIAQAGARFAQAKGLQNDAKYWNQALGIQDEPKEESSLTSSILGGVASLGSGAYSLSQLFGK